jgi:prevent-host-death family protein
MDIYNVHEAKTHFSRILAKVQAGEEVLIAKAGAPIARIVPVHAPKARIPDRDKGRIWVADDFDAPLPDELLDAFEGKS